MLVYPSFWAASTAALYATHFGPPQYATTSADLSAGRMLASLSALALKSMAPGIWPSFHDLVPLASSSVTFFASIAAFRYRYGDVLYLAGVNDAREKKCCGHCEQFLHCNPLVEGCLFLCPATGHSATRFLRADGFSADTRDSEATTPLITSTPSNQVGCA